MPWISGEVRRIVICSDVVKDLGLMAERIDSLMDILKGNFSLPKTCSSARKWCFRSRGTAFYPLGLDCPS
jgi:hypothetical protein